MRYCTVSDRTEFRVESVPHQSAKTFVLACCTWQLIVIPLWSLRADLNLPCRDFPIQTDTFLFSSLPVFLSLLLSRAAAGHQHDCEPPSPLCDLTFDPCSWTDRWECWKLSRRACQKVRGVSQRRLHNKYPGVTFDLHTQKHSHTHT